MAHISTQSFGRKNHYVLGCRKTSDMCISVRNLSFVFPKIQGIFKLNFWHTIMMYVYM
jgi:hypothetical protein